MENWNCSDIQTHFLQGEGAEVQGADHDAHRLRVGLHEHQP